MSGRLVLLACGTMRDELELWRGREGLYWLEFFGLVLFHWLVPHAVPESIIL